ncbi:MAG: ABC transporter ATP-binding protein [Patescibacteria group bacterium]
MSSIFLVEAASQYLLASTFLRFSEFSENIFFRDKLFTLEEFADWYADKFGKFSYYEDWTGFNIPSRILEPFLRGDFDPLNRKERRFLDIWNCVPKPFYIIGVQAGKIDLPTLKHEIIHGLFNTNHEYKSIVEKELADMNCNNIHAALENATYHKSVWIDETNAYAICGASGLIEDGLNLSSFLPVKKIARKVFRNFFGFDMVNASMDKVLGLVHRIPFGTC